MINVPNTMSDLELTAKSLIAERKKTTPNVNITKNRESVFIS